MMDDDNAVAGPSGFKSRPVKAAAARKKNAVAESEPSTSAASGAPEAKKRVQKVTKDGAVKKKVTIDGAVKKKVTTDEAVKKRVVDDEAVKKRVVDDEAVKKKVVDDKAVKKKVVDDEAVKNKDAKLAKPSKKIKTTLEMVCDAVKAVGQGKQGASAQAITKYVQNEKGPEATVKNFLISNAILKGIETGVLSRAPPKKGAVGESRRFVLVKKETNAGKQKVKKQKSNEDDIVKTSPKLAKKILSTTFVKGLSHTSTPKASANSETVKTSKIPKVRKKVTKSDLDDRKESSDTEIVVKPQRKSMKAYLSDTDIDFTVHLKEESKKKTRAAKVKPSQMDTQVKPPKSKGTVKLNSADQKTVKEKTNKPKKN